MRARFGASSSRSIVRPESLAARAEDVEAAELDVADAHATFWADAPAVDAASGAASVRQELAVRRESSARVEAELARLDRRIEALESRLTQLHAEQTELATTQRELAAEPVGTSDRDVAARAVVEAEARLDAAEARRRSADAETSRWQARADAFTQALEQTSGHAAATLEAFRGLDGIAGPLVDQLEIEPDARAAVTAALGDALASIVVGGEREARAAIERLAMGDAGALLLVLDARDTAVTTGATIAPAGARALAGCVRTTVPGLQATLARLLAGVVLADGDWRSAVDLAVENPELTVMTRAGDRFGGGRPGALVLPGRAA